MPRIELSRNRASERSRTRGTRRDRSAIQKGVTPLKSVAVDKSSMTSLSTKTYRPTGAAREPMLTIEQHADGNRAVIEFKAYLRGLIRHRRSFPDEASPTEVSTVLANAAADCERLTEMELRHHCIFMLNAGHDASTNMLSHGVHEILRSPGEICHLAETPGLVDSMAKEVPRCQAPIQINIRRSTRDTEMDGLPLPEWTTVHMIVAAANRGHRQFPDPDRFELARRPNRHLGFGLGGHICAGNSLARMDAAIAFRKLFGRFPGLRIMAQPEVAARLQVREIRHLNVAVN